ncbi:SpaA isopeptide-forming pilin-related protein, partial [Vagococcus fessus]
MRKKWFNIMMVGLLIFSNLVGSISIVKAATNHDYMTSSDFQREDGTPIGDGETVGIYEDTRVEYTWEIPNGDTIEEGDTMTFPFPEKLKATSGTNFDVTDSEGNVIGKATVDPASGQVVVTFTDYYQKNPQENRKGRIYFTTRWNGVNEGEEIEINIGEEGSTTINVGGSGSIEEGEQLGKWGNTLIEEGQTDWVVRINYAGKEIKNAVYTDTLGPNQEMLTTDFYANYGYYDENNKFIPVTAVDPNNIHISDSGFVIELGDLKQPNVSVEVYYRARITDDGASKEYTNKGELTGTDIEDQNVESVTPEVSGGGTGEGNNLGNINIIKTDEATGDVLAGAEFEVRNSEGEVVDTLTTAENGKAGLKNLPLGDYTVVETKAPDGYELDDTTHPVSVVKGEGGNTVQVDITNKKSPIPPVVPELEVGSLEITKTDEATGDVLAGAEFEVTNSEGEVVDTLKTDENGKASLKNLPLGDYTIVETKAPKGYELDKTEHKVSIVSGETATPVQVDITNKKSPVPPVNPELEVGSLEITKTDEATGDVLAGAEFEVRNSEGEVVDTLKTDENGKASLGNLPLGDYTILETKAPKGYELDKTEHKISIVSGETATPVQVDITNKKSPVPPVNPELEVGSLEITKTDEATGDVLAGAEFEVRNSEGEVVDTLKTDENGKASLGNLPLGDYTILETKAPKGYELDKTEHKISIVSGETATPVQ